MTYDQMIAANVWSGPVLEFRTKMANCIVDGIRFGSLELTTKTSSANDINLEKRIAEITTAVLMLALMDRGEAEITSVDDSGTSLERPDLDVCFRDGPKIGLEIAEVSNTDIAKHGSNRHLIEMTIRDLIDSDQKFACAFGKFYISVDLHGSHIYGRAPLERKQEALAIAAEIVEYVRSGQHVKAAVDHYTPAPQTLKVLSKRGSTFCVAPLESGSYFSMSDGAGTVGRVPQTTEVMRVLEKHRRSAATYRQGTLWLFLMITDSFEIFFDTMTTLAGRDFEIAPFEAVYIADSTGRVLRLKEAMKPSTELF